MFGCLSNREKNIPCCKMYGFIIRYQSQCLPEPAHPLRVETVTSSCQSAVLISVQTCSILSLFSPIVRL